MRTHILIQRGNNLPLPALLNVLPGPCVSSTCFSAQVPARTSGSSVEFKPGARTAWHSHPLGQTLLIISGRGLVQEWNGPVQEVRPGDVVWFPPDVKHWHGAASNSPMTHISICEALDGKNACWMEKVQ